MVHIESRPSKCTQQYDFYVDCEGEREDINKLVAALEKTAENVVVHSEYKEDGKSDANYPKI